jgi:hypothetical protein
MELLSSSKDETIKAFSDINFSTNVFNIVVNNQKYAERFIEYMPKDLLSDKIADCGREATIILENLSDDSAEKIVSSMAKSKTINKGKMAKLKKKLGVAFSKHIDTGSSFEGLVEDYFRKVNLGENTSGSSQRIKMVAEVKENITELCNSDNRDHNVRELHVLLMFVAAVVARTQRVTLENDSHPLTSMLHEIISFWKLRGRELNYYLGASWYVIRAELSCAGKDKKILNGKGATKKFTEKELDKIRTFLKM